MHISAKSYNDKAFSQPRGSLVAVIDDPSLKLPPYERSTSEYRNNSRGHSGNTLLDHSIK